MSETLERVTAAIKAEFGKAFNAKPLHGDTSSGDWFASGDPGSIDLTLLARAAIKGMRFPDMEKIRAVSKEIGIPPSTVDLVWVRYIDAVLAEPLEAVEKQA